MFKDYEENNDKSQNIIDKIKNKYRSLSGDKSVKKDVKTEKIESTISTNQEVPKKNKVVLERPVIKKVITLTPKNSDKTIVIETPTKPKPELIKKEQKLNKVSETNSEYIKSQVKIEVKPEIKFEEKKDLKELNKPEIKEEAKKVLNTKKTAPAKSITKKWDIKNPQRKNNNPSVHGEAYVYKRRMKNPKKFPFVKPQDAFLKTYPVDRRKTDKTRRGVLKVLVFWGLEQVWINCMGFEYNNQVLIVDMGLQFPDAYSNGISFRVPDLSYLKNKKVVWIAITHGHIDHIWGIPHLIKQFGKGVPIYATPMALELIKMKQEQFGYMPTILPYNKDKMVSVWEYFSVLPFVVDHSIPDSVGLMINTPSGRIVHTWDWKFDKTPPEFRPSVNYKTLESFWEMGVKMLLSDSTNAFMPWSSISEKEVITPLEDLFAWAKWRVITATFASIIDRIALIIKISEKFDRKVVLLWKWMNDYMNIAKRLGYVMHKSDTLISMDEADKLPDDKVTICCTWAQGERYAALMRIATWESRDTAFKAGDTVIFSSSVIPGNERSVQELFGLCLEAKVTIHHYRSSNIHAGWHARNEDVKHMISLIKPEYFMPIYGERYMLHENAKIAIWEWFPEDKVLVCRNWETLEINEEWKVERAWFIRANYITVDGAMVWMTKEKEIHEREQMKDSWVVLITINKSWNWWSVKIDSIGLPSFDTELLWTKEKVWQEVLNLINKDKTFFEDTNKSSKSIQKRIWNIIYQEIEKEPVIKIIINQK